MRVARSRPSIKRMLFHNEKVVFLQVVIIIWLWVGVCNSYWLVYELVRALVVVWGLVGVGLGGCWSGVW